MTYKIFFYCIYLSVILVHPCLPSLPGSKVWLHTDRADCIPNSWSASWAASHWWPPFTHMSSAIFSMPGASQKRPRMVDDSPPLSPHPRPVSRLFFFQRNGANVQPCGQLTGRHGPYANLMMGETVVSSARCRNDVSFGAALLLTLIYAELLMINRVRVCF